MACFVEAPLSAILTALFFQLFGEALDDAGDGLIGTRCDNGDHGDMLDVGKAGIFH